MKVAELLEQRRQNWVELERLCDQLEKRSRRALGAETVSRFATLYRATCADLALADAYQLPPNTVNYLHQLVGQAHNQLYRSRKFNPRLWLYQMLFELPPRLFRDNSLRLAFVLFWGVFLASMFMAFTSPQYSEQVLSKEGIASLEEMYAEPISGRSFRDDAFMAALYQWHNTGIGLRCLAAGVLFGIGGIFELIFNAGVLGAAFGHMATVPERKNFFEFVTAHGPFELTAIVLSAAGGMRLGFSLIYTQGMSRVASLRRAGYEAIPTISAAIILFALAAVIEGFISPSAAPYWVKAGVAGASSMLMLFYFVFLGWQPNAELNREEPTLPESS